MAFIHSASGVYSCGREQHGDVVLHDDRSKYVYLETYWHACETCMQTASPHRHIIWQQLHAIHSALCHCPLLWRYEAAASAHACPHKAAHSARHHYWDGAGYGTVRPPHTPGAAAAQQPAAARPASAGPQQHLPARPSSAGQQPAQPLGLARPGSAGWQQAQPDGPTGPSWADPDPAQRRVGGRAGINEDPGPGGAGGVRPGSAPSQPEAGADVGQMEVGCSGRPFEGTALGAGACRCCSSAAKPILNEPSVTLAYCTHLQEARVHHMLLCVC